MERKARSEIQPGERFGRYVVVGKATSKNAQSRYNMICDCGNTGIAYRNGLLRGTSTSCGCFRSEFHVKRLTTHNGSRSRLYTLWRGLLKRCYSEKYEGFHSYGGRGIFVSEAWRTSFENFANDMGFPPEGHSLDRIDVNGPYSKENCRWASAKEQQRNKRNNVLHFFRGRMVTIPEAMEEVGCTLWETAVRDRLRRGIPIEQALMAPSNSKEVVKPRENRRGMKTGVVWGKVFTAEAAHALMDALCTDTLPLRLVLSRMSRGWTLEDALFCSPSRWRGGKHE
jgi:hypothetical protein